MKHEQKHNPPMRYGMAIDLDKCTGCGSCMVACMSENNVPFKEDESDKLTSITWIRVYQLTNDKPIRIPKSAIFRGPASTVKAMGATVHVCRLPRNSHRLQPETGIVSQIYTRCFGCRYCMAACPYHARYFNWWDPIWPDGMEKYLSPNVSPRMRGVVEKCSFCFHRYQLAKNKAYLDDEQKVAEEAYQTACTQACPAGAIVFGDLNNPDHRVHQIVKPDPKNGNKSRNPRAFRLLERLSTNTKVYYLSDREWVRRAGDHYLAHEKTGQVSDPHH